MGVTREAGPSQHTRAAVCVLVPVCARPRAATRVHVCACLSRGGGLTGTGHPQRSSGLKRAPGTKGHWSHMAWRRSALPRSTDDSSWGDSQGPARGRSVLLPAQARRPVQPQSRHTGCWSLAVSSCVGQGHRAGHRHHHAPKGLPLPPRVSACPSTPGHVTLGGTASAPLQVHFWAGPVAPAVGDTQPGQGYLVLTVGKRKPRPTEVAQMPHCSWGAAAAGNTPSPLPLLPCKGPALPR